MQHIKEYSLFFLAAHVLFSVVAVGILALAAVQASITAVQSHVIKSHPLQTYPLLRHLPPLETMQGVLFKILWLGFIVLSLAFISAFFYIPNFWEHTQFSKLLLSISAWSLFATLLYGYHRSGWSSDLVTMRTIIGVLLLVIAYFGSKWIEQI